uniref:Uncharacterized protein n=1 Tax=Panagrolaimus davidi TaxID=227884 RepID=A0A914PJ69_9BILA
MRTPVISEQPDIPITSAPSVTTPSSVCTPSVCGTIDIVDGNDATIRPVFHQVPEDCDVLYNAFCEKT